MGHLLLYPKAPVSSMYNSYLVREPVFSGKKEKELTKGRIDLPPHETQIRI